MKRFFRFAPIAFSLILFSSAPRAQTPGLSGYVRAGAQAIAGALITARRASAPVAVTIVSDAGGRFEFPADRLPPDEYTLNVRAPGYALALPVTTRVNAGATLVTDLAVTPAPVSMGDFTDADYLAQMPGSDRDKRALATCLSCHTLERVVTSAHTAAQFIPVLQRMMNYAAETGQADIPQRKIPREYPPEKLAAFAAFLASINRSQGIPAWQADLTPPPRPSGAAARVVITEFQLPRATIEPHDVIADNDGLIWYSNGNEPFIGRLDPATGAHREFAYPLLKPEMPAGGLALEQDARGGLWLALMHQGGLARFDKKSLEFKLFPIPPGLDNGAAQQSMVMPAGAHVDGKVWTTDAATHSILRLDIATGLYERVNVFADGGSHTPYGLMADAANNLWFLDFGAESIGRIDAKTRAAAFYPTPTRFSHPRRGMMADGKIWFAEFAANKVGVFDMDSGKFREWGAPTPWSFPYDAAIDRLGYLWFGAMASGRVTRLDPETGAAVEYYLPGKVNIRRVFADNSTSPPSLWLGDNHGARIFRVEALE